MELVEKQQAIHRWARKYEPLELTSDYLKENVPFIEKPHVLELKQLPCKIPKPSKYGVRHKWRTKSG